MEARITLVYRDEKEAKTVSVAVSPDNIKPPKGLSVETFNVENRVVASIKYDGNSLMTFLSTIDDLLSCVSIAEKAFLAVKGLRQTSR